MLHLPFTLNPSLLCSISTQQVQLPRSHLTLPSPKKIIWLSRSKDSSAPSRSKHHLPSTPSPIFVQNLHFSIWVNPLLPSPSIFWPLHEFRPWGEESSENERCLARMKVTIDESFHKWKITSFNNVHNHDVLPLHVPHVDANLAEKMERLYPYADPTDFESSYVHEFDSDGYPYSNYEVPDFDNDFYPYSD
ncbi:hypothetical protein Dimus_031793 [Dionaea muscipula]